jgi:hypothetical protein
VPIQIIRIFVLVEAAVAEVSVPFLVVNIEFAVFTARRLFAGLALRGHIPYSFAFDFLSTPYYFSILYSFFQVEFLISCLFDEKSRDAAVVFQKRGEKIVIKGRAEMQRRVGRVPLSAHLPPEKHPKLCLPCQRRRAGALRVLFAAVGKGEIAKPTRLFLFI